MFKDLTIIDTSTVLAGPSVGTFFAELGAKVIKVEHPNHPDVTRTWKLPTESKDSSVSAYFSSINYQKDYVKLDLSKKEDYFEFLQLIKNADILLSNFKRSDYAKLNIEDATLRKHNSKLICGRISGFGSDSDRVAYDLILQAETGFMSMNGTTESGPVKMPVAFIDILAAHQLKEGILLAILEREKTGIAKSVSVSLYEAAVSSLTNQASNYLMEHHIPQRIGSLHPNIAPYGEIFQTKDGQLITFAIGSDIHFNKLCDFLELNNLPESHLYKTNPDRVKNRTALAQQLQEAILNFKSSVILDAMLDYNVPAGKIKTMDQVFEDQKAKDLCRTEIIDGHETNRVSSIAFKWE